MGSLLVVLLFKTATIVINFAKKEMKRGNRYDKVQPQALFPESIFAFARHTPLTNRYGSNYLYQPRFLSHQKITVQLSPLFSVNHGGERRLVRSIVTMALMIE